MKKCRCGGSFKIVTEEYNVATRHQKRPNFVFENIQKRECTICGYSELTEESQVLVQILKKYIQAQMEKDVEQSTSDDEKTGIFKVFKR